MEQPTDYMFAGAASLAEQLDKLVMLVLRDGRHIVGTLVSYDHFGSLVLANALERHFGGGLVHDVPMGGVYLVRGENLAILCELDPARDRTNPLLRPASWEEVRAKELEEDAAIKTSAAAMGAATASSSTGSHGKASWVMTE